jgi:2-oxoisovalerate dehydrogenase E1 component
MVVRIAGCGDPKSFGAHFRNDDSVATLRDVPGLVIASPARPDDAAARMRTCLAAGRADGLDSVFIPLGDAVRTVRLDEPTLGAATRRCEVTDGMRRNK